VFGLVVVSSLICKTIKKLWTNLDQIFRIDRLCANVRKIEL